MSLRSFVPDALLREYEGALHDLVATLGVDALDPKAQIAAGVILCMREIVNLREQRSRREGDIRIVYRGHEILVPVERGDTSQEIAERVAGSMLGIDRSVSVSPRTPEQPRTQ